MHDIGRAKTLSGNEVDAHKANRGGMVMKATIVLILLFVFSSHCWAAADLSRAKELARCYKIVVPPIVFNQDDYSDREYQNLIGLEKHFKRQAKSLAGNQWELVSFMALSWAEGVVSTHQFNGEQLHDYRDWVLNSCREYYGNGGYKHVRLKDSEKLMIADTDGSMFN